MPLLLALYRDSQAPAMSVRKGICLFHNPVVPSALCAAGLAFCDQKDSGLSLLFLTISPWL